MLVKRAVDQVHPDDPERFLLVDVRLVQHSHVDDDLARLAPGFRLITHPEPAVRFVALLETAGRHRIRKNKKRPLIADLLIEPLDQKRILVVEHRAAAGCG